MIKASTTFINLTSVRNDDTLLLFVLSMLCFFPPTLNTVIHNSLLEYDEDGSEISQRQLQEHPEWTRHE